MGSPAFIFLCKLAWAARYRIPIIISVAFMAFDIRMQLEINVQMRTVQRQRSEDDIQRFVEDDISDDSWITIEEETDQDEVLDEIGPIAH